MGMIFRMVIAFGVGIGGLAGAQHFWLSAVVSQITAQPQTPMMPQGPVMPAMSVNAEQMAKALNSTNAPIDTTAGQRAAIQNLGHQNYLQNRAAANAAPLPPSIPGLRH